MSLFPQPAIIGASEYSKGYPLEDSLRLRSSASAYLTRTPSSAGNRTTWTFSFWAKRGALGSDKIVLSAGTTGSTDIDIFFPSDLFMISDRSGFNVKTTSLYRDPSAWYHFVVKFDTTQATASDRIKLYVNGSQITSLDGATSYPGLNATSSINNNVAHYIGTRSLIDNRFDGYLTEVNLIDGQALDPSYFGETDVVTGVWKPKKYIGTYGTNGFYLPMTPTSQAEGFNTVLWKGTGATQSINGVGFSPDFVWVKYRDAATENHMLFDSVRGALNRLQSDSTAVEFNQSGSLTSFDSDGFSVSTTVANMNTNGANYVTWCWDAGSGSPVSNTDGTITSTVKANQAKGFSVVTYTGTGSAATIGHGLGTAPSMIIVKNRSSAFDWAGYHVATGPTINYPINVTAAGYTNIAYWNNTSPTSSVFSVGNNSANTNTNGSSFVAYCFSEVAGYSKIGSYTGTGASGNSITTGFKPAWLLIKRTDSADKWTIRDCVRSPFNPVKQTLNPNDASAEYTPSGEDYDFDSNGFTLNNSNGAYNASGGTYIYMAIADTRNTAFNNDASGNQNNWTPNNINSNASGQSTYDLMKDVPTLTDADAGNFCTLNPLDNNSGVVSEGNLKYADNGSDGWNNSRGTLGVSSGKWYWELSPVANMDVMCASVASNLFPLGSLPGQTNNYGVTYYNNGLLYKETDGAGTSYGASYTTNDVIGVALDMDAGSVTFYKNNVSQGVASTNLKSYGDIWFPITGVYRSSTTVVYNFGQRPFAYTPPSGYKALNTYNLPTPTIKDGEDYFNTVLYTGNGGTNRSITGVGFPPDLVWIKERNTAVSHMIYNSVVGANKRLSSDNANAEATDSDGLKSFDSDGWTMDAKGSINGNGDTYVAWNWKANGSGVSNTDGSITSTVSANTSSGFSVVTYTGNGTNGSTIGHGLGIAPSFFVVKSRDAATSWRAYHSSLGATKYITLNNTDAAGTASSLWNNTAPSSSVITVGTDGDSNLSARTYVIYAFAPIEGYSAFGSYTGNGSTDGPFVYTGFRPAWLMLKRTDVANGWPVIDTKRDTYNVMGNYLYPNTSGAEATYYYADFTSNGFKLRATDAGVNASGGTYIYAAFAENPFKYSLAR